MITQDCVSLIYLDKKYKLATDPLQQYLALMPDNPFDCLITENNLNEYKSTWEVKGSKLYLTNLLIDIEGFERGGIDFIFAEQEEVFAGWFTGKMNIPNKNGNAVKFDELDYYDSLFEEELVLEFRNGLLIDEQTTSNRNKLEFFRLENHDQKLFISEDDGEILF